VCALFGDQDSPGVYNVVYAQEGEELRGMCGTDYTGPPQLCRAGYQTASVRSTLPPI